MISIICNALPTYESVNGLKFKAHVDHKSIRIYQKYGNIQDMLNVYIYSKPNSCLLACMHYTRAVHNTEKHTSWHNLQCHGGTLNLQI